LGQAVSAFALSAGQRNRYLPRSGAITPRRPLEAVIAMRHLNGLTAAAILDKACPAIKGLILSMHNNPHPVPHILRSGAQGCVLKQTNADELIEATKIVAAGGTFFSLHFAQVAFSQVIRVRASDGLSRIKRTRARGPGRCRRLTNPNPIARSPCSRNQKPLEWSIDNSVREVQVESSIEASL
jgi:hypothetical protein